MSSHKVRQWDAEHNQDHGYDTNNSTRCHDGVAFRPANSLAIMNNKKKSTYDDRFAKTHPADWLVVAEEVMLAPELVMAVMIPLMVGVLEVTVALSEFDPPGGGTTAAEFVVFQNTWSIIWMTPLSAIRSERTIFAVAPLRVTLVC